MPVLSEWGRSLLSVESLERCSPELWPEPIPGVREYAARNYISASRIVPSLDQIQTFNANDYSLINRYNELSVTGLLSEVRKLHDLTFQLGLEEAKEMTRGRFLNILHSGPNIHRNRHD